MTRSCSVNEKFIVQLSWEGKHLQAIQAWQHQKNSTFCLVINVYEMYGTANPSSVTPVSQILHILLS
jgi:hypothetical protein